MNAKEKLLNNRTRIQMRDKYNGDINIVGAQPFCTCERPERHPHRDTICKGCSKVISNNDGKVLRVTKAVQNHQTGEYGYSYNYNTSGPANKSFYEIMLNANNGMSNYSRDVEEKEKKPNYTPENQKMKNSRNFSDNVLDKKQERMITDESFQKIYDFISKGNSQNQMIQNKPKQKISHTNRNFDDQINKMQCNLIKLDSLIQNVDRELKELQNDSREKPSKEQQINGKSSRQKSTSHDLRDFDFNTNNSLFDKRMRDDRNTLNNNNNNNKSTPPEKNLDNSRNTADISSYNKSVTRLTSDSEYQYRLNEQTRSKTPDNYFLPKKPSSRSPLTMNDYLSITHDNPNIQNSNPASISFKQNPQNQNISYNNLQREFNFVKNHSSMFDINQRKDPEKQKKMTDDDYSISGHSMNTQYSERTHETRSFNSKKEGPKTGSTNLVKPGHHKSVSRHILQNMSDYNDMSWNYLNSSENFEETEIYGELEDPVNSKVFNKNLREIDQFPKNPGQQVKRQYQGSNGAIEKNSYMVEGDNISRLFMKKQLLDAQTEKPEKDAPFFIKEHFKTKERENSSSHHHRAKSAVRYNSERGNQDFSKSKVNNVSKTNRAQKSCIDRSFAEDIEEGDKRQHDLEFLKIFQNEKEKKYLDFLLNQDKFWNNNYEKSRAVDNFHPIFQENMQIPKKSDPEIYEGKANTLLGKDEFFQGKGPKTLYSYQNSARTVKKEETEKTKSLPLEYKLKDDKRLGNDDKRLGNDDRKLANEDKRLANNDIRLGNNDIRLGNDDRRLGNDDRRLGNDDKRLGNDDRRLGNDDRKLANEDRRLGNDDRRFGNDDRRLGNDDRRLGNDDKRMGIDVKSNNSFRGQGKLSDRDKWIEHSSSQANGIKTPESIDISKIPKAESSTRIPSSRMGSNADKELEQALFSHTLNKQSPSAETPPNKTAVINSNTSKLTPPLSQTKAVSILSTIPERLPRKQTLSLKLNLIGEMVGHRSSVDCLEIFEKNNILWSGSHDYSIRVWNLNELNRDYQNRRHEEEKKIIFKSNKLIKGHSRGVRCLCIGNQGIFSGGSDNTIRAWSMESLKQIKIMKDHNGCITSLLNTKTKLLSSSGDETIRLWDQETYGCIHSFHEHRQRIESLLGLKGGKDEIQTFLSCSVDRDIKLWDIRQSKCIQTLDGAHDDAVTSLELQNSNSFISGGLDKKLKVWDMRIPKVVMDYELNSECYTMKKIEFDEKEYLLCGNKCLEVYEMKGSSNAGGLNLLNKLDFGCGSIRSIKNSANGKLRRLYLGTWGSKILVLDYSEGC